MTPANLSSTLARRGDSTHTQDQFEHFFIFKSSPKNLCFIALFRPIAVMGLFQEKSGKHAVINAVGCSYCALPLLNALAALPGQQGLDDVFPYPCVYPISCINKRVRLPWPTDLTCCKLHLLCPLQESYQPNIHSRKEQP